MGRSAGKRFRLHCQGMPLALSRARVRVSGRARVSRPAWMTTEPTFSVVHRARLGRGSVELQGVADDVVEIGLVQQAADIHGVRTISGDAQLRAGMAL